MSKTIEIVDYDPQWAALSEKEKRRILEVVGDIIARAFIEYVIAKAKTEAYK